jgi:RNA polymerase subunit RPABC4/transcription elongation factor Spt4
MAIKEKACLNCKAIYSGATKCPNCGETPVTETIKGRIQVFDSKVSELAYNMGINGNGEFAIKVK